MIKKKYLANTPEMEKLAQQATSGKFTEKNYHYASSLTAVVEFFQTTYTYRETTKKV